MTDYSAALKERGLSLKEFSDRVGFSTTYVREILQGKREAPPETEKKIRKELASCPWCHHKWPRPLPDDKPL